MNSLIKQCPVCGSNKIKEIIQNNNVQCQCLSCGSMIIDSEHNNKKSPTEIFNNSLKSVVEIVADFKNESCAGTGFFIKKDLVVTCAHILINKEEISDNIYGNFYHNDKTFILELVSIDDELDTALLKTKNIDSTPVKLEEKEVETGETVYSIGNAIGQGLTIVSGNISDAQRVINGIPYILHTAPVNHGNSGGPLFNEKGNVIGMISSSRKDAKSMNYALPMFVIIK